MIDLADFREMVIRPALAHLDLSSPSAEALLMGTALAESGLEALRQYGGGPARGLFQMEPATHDDIFDHFLAYRPALRERLTALAAPTPPGAEQLAANLIYAAAMCRIHYRRVPAALSHVADAAAMARYWKDHYNTELGRGDPAHFEDLYVRHVQPLYEREA